MITLYFFVVGGGGDAILVLASTSNRTDLNGKPILCL